MDENGERVEARKKDGLIGVENFTGLGEEIDLSVRVLLGRLEEVLRGLYEGDAFAPAGGHCWKQGKRGRRGRTESVTRKEVEEEMCGETRDGCGQGVPLIPEIAIIILVRGGHESRKHLMIT